MRKQKLIEISLIFILHLKLKSLLLCLPIYVSFNCRLEDISRGCCYVDDEIEVAQDLLNIQKSQKQTVKAFIHIILLVKGGLPKGGNGLHTAQC